MTHTPNEVPEAWVKLADLTPFYQALRDRGEPHPYDFGFMPAMARLIASHPRIGPMFSALFSQIMFSPEGNLTRSEREMVAAVSAATQDCRY
jgi:hypothetical protein